MDNWDVKAAICALNSSGCFGHMPSKTCKLSLPIRLKARDQFFVDAHDCPKAGYRETGETNRHLHQHGHLQAVAPVREPQGDSSRPGREPRTVGRCSWAAAGHRRWCHRRHCWFSRSPAGRRICCCGGGSIQLSLVCPVLSAGRSDAFHAQPPPPSHLLLAAAPPGPGPGVAMDDDDEATQSELQLRWGEEAEAPHPAVAAGSAATPRPTAASPTFDSSCPVSYDVDLSGLCPWLVSQPTAQP